MYDPLSVGKHWAALLPTALLASDAGTPRLALGMLSGAVLMLGPTGEAHAAAGVLHERTLRAAHFLIPKQVGCLASHVQTAAYVASHQHVLRGQHSPAHPLLQLPPHPQSTVADSVLVVLNDAQQFSSANGQATAPIAHHVEQQQRSKTAAAAVQQLTAAGQPHLADFSTDSEPHPPCQGRGCVAAAYHHSASHMLASAVELCPLALEQLLL